MFAFSLVHSLPMTKLKSNLGYLMSYALLNRGLWIWIRMDPYPGGENLKEKNRKNARKLV